MCIHILVLLRYHQPQFRPISRRGLQLFKPFLGSTAQIQLGDLKQLVSIEITHLGSHCEPLRPIVHIYMIPTPEQLVHPLRTCHLTGVQQQQKQNAVLLTSHSPSNKKQLQEKWINLSAPAT